MRSSSRSIRPLVFAVLVGLLGGELAFASKQPKKATTPAPAAPAVPPELFSSMAWREVGPYRGGRSAAVTGLPGDRNTYYFGSCGGGVWKTTDAGLSWKNVSDGTFGGSIGAVAVSEWDPNVVYVGTGEVTVRGNVSEGDGMWKSTDAGKTWEHVGLPESRHITRIRIHPKNPDLVYAAVLGHLFGPNPERGVYRSKDGGGSWERILFANDDAGAVDLMMDPKNPRVLYASTWRVRRTPYSLESGGAGSALWKSIDGGDHWEELTKNVGLPSGTLGIIGITVSPSNPDNLYAIVEAEKGGVFRSRDAGKTWEKTNESRDLRQRAWYYSRIYADPVDQEAVYVVNVQFHRSSDGGRSFRRIRTPHGDNHDLWIDPADPKRMIESNDGGAQVSNDGGATWTSQDGQPTAQMYRISTDDDLPYRILGGQQDNSAVRIRSRSFQSGGIGARDWEPTAGGEAGHVVARPGSPNTVVGGEYGGFLELRDHDTGQSRAINPWPDEMIGAGAIDARYRFQWNFPVFFSPHDRNVLYAGSNVLHRSDDLGQSWQVVSGDLTRNDPTKLGPSGGPITKDNTGVEVYATIFAATESRHEKGVLWTGSDDGLVHVSRDAGKTWTKVTPPDLPEWSMVNSLDVHPFEKGGLYLAATRYKLDDATPYLFRTLDYGATWTRIDSDLPRTHFTRVVRADPGRRGLLYAGTERGVYVSFDDGARWQPLQLKLPLVPVTDLAVKDGDLIASTQGRGYWILDHIAVLHQVEPKSAAEPVVLYAPTVAQRVPLFRADDAASRKMGTNPHRGLVLQYVLRDEPAKDTEAKIEIFDATGAVIRTYTREPAEGAEDEDRDEPQLEEDLRQVPLEKGGNVFAWDLSHPPATRFPGLILWNDGLEGPVALPGKYSAKLTVGNWSGTVPFEIAPDPRTKASAADLAAQFELVRGIRDQLTRMHSEIGRLRDVSKQLDTLLKRIGDEEKTVALRDAAKALKEKLVAVEEALYQTKNQSQQDPLNFPVRLNDKLAGVLNLASRGDFAPTDSMIAVRNELTKKIDAQMDELTKLMGAGLADVNRLAREAEVPLIAPMPKTK